MSPTRVILAAVGDARDEKEAAAVIETARRLGEATGHECRVVRTRAATALLRLLDRPGVTALVLGSASPATGTGSLGVRTRMVVERARKPVVVVPAGAVVPKAIRRVLVPLEGTPGSSRPVVEELCPLFPSTVHIQVLHAFTPDTLPRMLDRPARDLEMLGREFLARHCPPAHGVELHHGSVATRAAEIAGTGGADLVVLSWSQDSSDDRAKIVRSLLAASPVPVLLLPALRGAAGREGGKVPSG